MTRKKRSTASPVISASSASRPLGVKAPPPPPNACGNSSWADWLASLDRTEVSERLAEFSEDQLWLFLYDWRIWARPAQLAPPGDWRTWLLLAGRGFGKTRSGAEWVRLLAEDQRAMRIALVAPTAADFRATMIEGESGLLA